MGPSRQPACVLATGSTSGHGCSLPEPTTADTGAGASSISKSAAERGATAPQPGRLTTLHLPEQNCTIQCRGAVSLVSGTKTSAGAEIQRVFGWNTCRGKKGVTGDKDQL